MTEYKDVLKTFDFFVGQQLCPIALRPNSKIPVLKSWNSWDEKSNRDVLTKTDDINIGLLLGKVIDVEGDTPKANDVLLKLIGDYKHPSYKSSKSIHHLFLTPDPKLRIVKYKGVEFRGNGHQSVLPPSKVIDTSYNWIEMVFPIPTMPIALLDYFKKVRKSNQSSKPVIKPGHMKINCKVCNDSNFIHKSRFNLELIAFREKGHAWQCHKCRNSDLRTRCRQIRKIIQKNPILVDWRKWQFC